PLVDEQTGTPRRLTLGGVDVALHLGERDRTLGQPTVLTKDRVEETLPALIAQALRVGAIVFDEAVAIRIAVAVDPLERGFDRRPQLAQGGGVAGARGGGGG